MTPLSVCSKHIKFAFFICKINQLANKHFLKTFITITKFIYIRTNKSGRECTWSFFILLCTWVVVLLFFRIISVSGNLVGSNSKVSFIFLWYKFKALFSIIKFNLHNVSRREVLKVSLYPLPSCWHKYPKEQQISSPFVQPSVCLISLLFAEKTYSFVSLFSSLLKIDFSKWL